MFYFKKRNIVSRLLISIALMVFIVFYHTAVKAENPNRPFWTEKSTFVEGENLFVIGVASNAKTVEDGRLKAFEHGKIELMNYAQITDLEAQGLVIETQMTYEEPHKDGTVSVFRLLRVPADKLLSIQGRMKVQSEEQDRKLKEAQAELIALNKTLTEKQQVLQTQAISTENMFKKISAMEESLSARAKQIEEQQKEVEALLSKLTGNISKKGTIQSKLQDVEEQLDTREQEIAKIRQKILNRIKQQPEQACKFVTKGMTEKDVKSMLGEPAGRSSATGRWTYGTAEFFFDDSDIVKTIYGCL